MKAKENSKAIMMLSVTLVIGILLANTARINAKTRETQIPGYICEFDGKDDYNLSASSSDTNTYGSLVVEGENYSLSAESNLTTISVNRDYTDDSTDYNLSLSYQYTNDLLKASDKDWHLVESGDKSIGEVSLGEKIKNGALVLQVSCDQKNWTTTFTQTNIFKDAENGLDDFYTTTQVQLANGCYYRAIVAYEVKKQSDSSKILFWDKKSYENIKKLEIYYFYVVDKEAENVVTSENDKKYNLGERVRCEKSEGYYGSKTITKSDPHYGWKLGEFFVGGYTDAVKDSEGNIIFLKNTGDQVGLWFNLEQDINALNGNSAITIEADEAGSDQYFETETMNFGKGTLLVRKTNYENVQEETQIYNDYLLANATVGANTKVDLFEEGDYEVALDYVIKYEKTKIFGASVLPKESHYRIYFKFSVRNANSMFYPRDVVTKSELSNNAITSNGFYLDLANSKYLRLNIVRETLKDDAIGSEDVRSNNVAKDGDQYTEEGIYTVTVTNQYTGKSTTKKLYVGDDDLLKAYMTTGLSISEIQDEIAKGATVDSDGNLIKSTLTNVKNTTSVDEEVTETVSDETVEYTAVDDNVQDQSEADEQSDGIDKTGTVITYIALLVVAIAIVTVIGLNGRKKNKKKSGGK